MYALGMGESSVQFRVEAPVQTRSCLGVVEPETRREPRPGEFRSYRA